jgi:hypothetical protein
VKRLLIGKLGTARQTAPSRQGGDPVRESPPLRDGAVPGSPRAFVAVCLVAGLVVLTGCSREAPAPRTVIAASDAPATGMAHGNHDPKYGGFVLMNGEMHMEIVAKEDGRYTVYFSDAARRELPATVVSDVKLGITRTGFRAEPVDLKISDTGESWEGKGGFVDDRDATLKITFLYQGKLCTSDMPFFAGQPQKVSMQK